jgi:hypothetical protein
MSWVEAFWFVFLSELIQPVLALAVGVLSVLLFINWRRK